jgi:hypothetical protein
MRPQIFELSALVAYAGAIAFLYQAVNFLSERDYVAAILCAGVGLSVARLAGDLLRFALWRAWAEERSRPSGSSPDEP